MRIRRIIAATIDIFIMLIILAVILIFIPFNDTIRTKNAEINELAPNFASLKNLDDAEKSKMTNLNYEVEHEMVKYYLIIAVVIIVYFIFIPKIKKDQTFGQKMLKVRLVSDNQITLNTYIIRAILNTGLILMIFCPLFVYIFNAIWYSIVASILYLIQIIYWLVSLFMLLITSETIHDKLTNTKIIEVKR